MGASISATKRGSDWGLAQMFLHEPQRLRFRVSDLGFKVKGEGLGLKAQASALRAYRSTEAQDIRLGGSGLELTA